MRVLALVILCAAACADASGTVSGGEGRFDAQSPINPPMPSMCGEGMTWTSLYKDYFGPSSKGTCSGATGDENNCHLAPSAAGALASNGYVCGMTKDSCWDSFAQVLVPAMSGKKHYFEAVLRQATTPMCPPTCLSPMPLRPASAQFSDCDLDRIRKWADNGAKND